MRFIDLSYFKRRLKIEFARYFEKTILNYQRKKIRKIFKKHNEILLIYSIGKVGSSTLYNSFIKAKHIFSPVFHIHSLNPKRLEEQKEYYRNSVRKSVPFHLLQSTVITEELSNYQGRLKVFTLIREPIGRELSSVYQDSFNFTKTKEISKSLIIKIVNEKFASLIEILPEHEWFERELKTVLGINIYEFDFNVEQGYLIFKNKKLDFVLVRLENLNESYSEWMNQLFIEGDKIKLITVNESKDKFYDDNYQLIKKDVVITNKDFNKIINSDFIQKFYPDFIHEIKNKWVQK